MPDGDGLSVLRHIREEQATLRIFIMTGGGPRLPIEAAALISEVWSEPWRCAQAALRVPGFLLICLPPRRNRTDQIARQRAGSGWRLTVLPCKMRCSLPVTSVAHLRAFCANAPKCRVQYMDLKMEFVGCKDDSTVWYTVSFWIPESAERLRTLSREAEIRSPDWPPRMVYQKFIPERLWLDRHAHPCHKMDFWRL
jgi:hypothetical protein